MNPATKRPNSSEADGYVIARNKLPSKEFKPVGGGFGLTLSHKKKVELIKLVREKEKRGWECLTIIKEIEGYFTVRMVFDRRPVRDQV